MKTIERLSPSSLSTYAWCPAAWKARYVDGVVEPASVALGFGTAVHAGLEHHYLGLDPVARYRQAWRQQRDQIQAEGSAVPARLTGLGLDLIEQVVALGLAGVPERRIWLDTTYSVGRPILGYADLWNQEDGYVVDLKTTAGKWNQARADREVWQPGLYSLAYYLAYDRLPEFRYVVMDRGSGQVQVFATEITHDRMRAAVRQARATWVAIEARQFACRCGRCNPGEASGARPVGARALAAAEGATT